jgi:5-methylcytosine-specific restriction protein A
MQQLSPRKIDELKHDAVLAFGGRETDLESGNGFRVFVGKEQIAAIYWRDNLPPNQIEIAIYDALLAKVYDLRTVRRWIERELEQAPHPCNIHKHGSNWPSLGFSYDRAIAFLARLKLLRAGLLAPPLLAELRRPLPDQQQAADENLGLVLASLQPNSKQAVIDLVRAAGIDTACWHVNQDGSTAAKPRSNPAYCYNWCFGGGAEPILVCLWYDAIKPHNGQIVFNDNLRQTAEQLDSIADAAGADQETRNRAQAQARRARAVDVAFSAAYKAGRALRVIVNEGQRRPDDSLGRESSKVEMRMLDPVGWRVELYDNASGALRLVRESTAGTATAPANGHTNTSPPKPAALETSMPPTAPAAPSLVFVDQYTIGTDQVSRKELSGQAYERSRLVRDAALARAAGVCQLCGQPGFLTAGGTVFLETHHVVPLSEGGADRLDNVVAICPNDHREAHYGRDAKRIRARLLLILAELRPAQTSAMGR